MFSEGSAQGISIDDIDHGEVDEVIFDNIVVRNIRKSTQSAPGITTGNIGVSDNKRILRLSNITLEKCDVGIDLGDNWLVEFQNVRMQGCDRCWDVEAGCKVWGTNCVMDFSNSLMTAPSYAVVMRSDGTSGGAEFRFLDAPVIIKGASNAPTAIFHEQDTTAAKTVYFPDAYDYDNGFTATIGRTSGHTTLNAATDVNTVTL